MDNQTKRPALSVKAILFGLILSGAAMVLGAVIIALIFMKTPHFERFYPLAPYALGFMSAICSALFAKRRKGDSFACGLIISGTLSFLVFVITLLLSKGDLSFWQYLVRLVYPVALCMLFLILFTRKKKARRDRAFRFQKK